MSSQLTPEERSGILLTNILPYDCGVIALQAITRIPRVRAEELLTVHGYDEEGTPREALPTVLRAHGYKVNRDVPFQRHETAATFTTTHEYGTYLVFTNSARGRHVMALIDGDLHNSRSHWHSSVDEVMEVTHE
jgi:hypothetical protein